MDPDGPVSRVERTLLTAWNYITEAVSRFFRADPADAVAGSTQESAAAGGPATCSRAERDTGEEGGNEEQASLATASAVGSPRPVVAWELCNTAVDLGPDEAEAESNTAVCEEGESTREQQADQTGSEDTGLLIIKYAEAKEEEEKENRDVELCSFRRDGGTRSPTLPHDAVTADLEKTAEEDTDEAMVSDDQQKINETVRSFQVKEEETEMLPEGEKRDSKDPYAVCSLGSEETGVKLCNVTELSLEEEEARILRDEGDAGVTHEASVGGETENGFESDEGPQAAGVEKQPQVCEETSDNDRDFKQEPGEALLDSVLHDELQTACDKSDIVSSDEVTVVGQEQLVAEYGAKEQWDGSAAAEREQGPEIKEVDLSETADQMREQREEVKGITEESEGDRVMSEVISGGFTQNVQTEVRRDGEQEAEDTEAERDAEEQPDQTTIDISAEEQDRVEEERRESSEDDEKENDMEITCNQVTVRPESNSGEEMSRELMTPQGICEGLIVVSQISTAEEETREEVPEYNNGREPSENTAQRFLEGAKDWEEIQTAQLPEEVETKGQESLENSGSDSEAEHLQLQDHMEEEQDANFEKAEDVKGFEVNAEERDGVTRLVDTELSEETEKSLAGESSEIQSLEKDVCPTDGSDRTEEKLHDETEQLLDEYEIFGRPCDAKGGDTGEIVGQEDTRAVTAQDVFRSSDETLKVSEADMQNMTETIFSLESVDAEKPDENVDRTLSLLEDVAESGSVTLSGETETQDIRLRLEDIMEVEETDGKGNASIGRSDKNEPPVELLETENLISDEELEVIRKKTPDAEVADESLTNESKRNDASVISGGEMGEAVECDVEETGALDCRRPIETDEEILDMWTEAVLSEDVGVEAEMPAETKDNEPPEESEPGQEMPGAMLLSDEEEDEMLSEQSETEEEHLLEANSGESGLASDGEMSSASESGILDQLPGAEAFPDTTYTSDSMSDSAEMSDLSEERHESPSLMIKETDAAEGFQILTETEFHPDSSLGLFETTDQVSGASQHEENQEDSDSLPTGAELQRESRPEVIESSPANKIDWKDSEETDFEMNSLIRVERMKVQHETLEKTATDRADELKRAESGLSNETAESPKLESEARSEQGMALTESGSQSESRFESRNESIEFPSPGDEQSERPVVVVEPESMTEAEDQCEADSSTLDFAAQRSRIAVKNPRVRPPTDPRSLLQMPSVEPTPPAHLPVKAPAGVPLGGLGIGIKLPGFGGGFPVLKKTQRAVREENKPDDSTQEDEAKPDEKDDAPKQDEVQPRPKWMPPRNPGFGNPLMSELKTKLRKTTNE